MTETRGPNVADAVEQLAASAKFTRILVENLHTAMYLLTKLAKMTEI